MSSYAGVLPSSHVLDSKRLGMVFDKTTATYKYYWFLSILELFCQKQRHQIDFSEIVISMISYAWYPVRFAHLSFGLNDSLHTIIEELAYETNLGQDDKKDEIKKALLERYSISKSVRDNINALTRYVPYRFLNPWIENINSISSKKVIELSVSFHNDCFYAIKTREKPILAKGKTQSIYYIELNPKWYEYMVANYKVLHDFCFWNLCDFLEKKNPNTPTLLAKLEKVTEREGLTSNISTGMILLQRQVASIVSTRKNLLQTVALPLTISFHGTLSHTISYGI